MYVYKITNIINNKIYIGITNNYKKRWSNEKTNPKDPAKQQVITRAIAKYGVENFNFELLDSHLTIEEACEKEKRLIKELNCLVPNGYNVDEGGNYHPNFKPQLGENNGNSKLSDEEAQYIKNNRDKPMYVLYEEFNDKISYETFKKCYKHQTYTHLPISIAEYPYNLEFSSQFKKNGLEYDEVIEIRNRYNNKEYWKNVYKDYKDKFSNEMSFWRMYTGLSYKLIMPEVFTEENKKFHASYKNAGNNNGRAKLNSEDVKKIRELHNQGITNKELYTLYPQVSQTSIRDIINFKTWKNLV